MTTVHDDNRFVHLADLSQRPRVLTRWEQRRHKNAHWFVELFSEAMGVFIYCFAGVGSTAAYVLGTLAGSTGLSSIQQIGLAYGAGIVIALVITSATSGHINPAVTLTFAATGKFPWRKVPQYIAAQILGGYIACLLVYVQYETLIKEVEVALAAKSALDAVNFTPQGPAGIFGLYVLPGAHLGRAFLNEFVCAFLIGLVIFACLDPTNFFAPPAAGPWIIAFAYAIMVWGFSPNGLALNTARDMAGRLAVLTLWGTKAAGGRYAAIAALTNIPATMLAAAVYEFMFTDSSRVLTPAARDHLEGHKAHLDRKAHGSALHLPMQGHHHQHHPTNGAAAATYKTHSDKATAEMVEHAA
ncbi:aquaporin-like protein [Punctularia strigosozonata HHB-11173 SS5]|uniref:Aquaporin-like protein n=1 Tax=Punctularia strigosozonata (strain HHB-11173) TaxID=741275 RepID=R7S007_PUNST|nr:aquaporin-like protein [Punctularia strigosozonata HHB-11173 SS5]EIN03700.1 aquaporin-like protein [Punctularia strigosozonata HHB-11173 SS5]